MDIAEQADDITFTHPSGNQTVLDDKVVASSLDFSEKAFRCAAVVFDKRDEIIAAIEEFIKAYPVAGRYKIDQAYETHMKSYHTSTYVLLSEYVRIFHALPPVDANRIVIPKTVASEILQLFSLLQERGLVSSDLYDEIQSFADDPQAVRHTSWSSLYTIELARAIEEVTGSPSPWTWVLARISIPDEDARCFTFLETSTIPLPLVRGY